MKVKLKVMMSRAPATALCRPSPMSHAPHPFPPGIQMSDVHPSQRVSPGVQPSCCCYHLSEEQMANEGAGKKEPPKKGGV